MTSWRYNKHELQCYIDWFLTVMLDHIEEFIQPNGELIVDDKGRHLVSINARGATKLLNFLG